jgi:tyrosine phenol-lyase
MKSENPVSATSCAPSASISLRCGESLPIEFHKVRVVQRVNLAPVERRLAAIREAGFNTFLLPTKDVFLDMLTDSGTNAMSDAQVAAMSVADDAYAGSASFERFEAAARELFGKDYVLPAHQGRAAEHVICQAFVKPGSVVPMNYHFTTTRAHIELAGGEIRELVRPCALVPRSSEPFKGNIDIEALERALDDNKGRVPFVRMEASTNLIGGQPFSLANLRSASKAARIRGIPLVLDASLLGENVWFMKRREAQCASMTPAEIFRAVSELADIIYFSARKLSSSRGGAILTSDEKLYGAMRDLIPLFEGFLTYGGISVREIEAMAVGLRESCDEAVIGQSPSFIEHLAQRLDAAGVPVVLPAGALGCHVDARAFLPALSSSEYPAGALAAAFFIASGIRGMERGTLSSTRDAEGKEIPSDMELLRLALPRRVYTLSQIRYAEDRLEWLYENRDIVGGLRFVEEPPVLRFFTGRLEAVDDWPERLAAKYREDFGASL